ncbi:sugar ABC transporter substrate-binding protein [Leifsonia sp. C5G2]|uniref:ABC transporter substrate-binding protein n=1 Tax=Leifsonia sp. C5G2 TaxID=2735269 RepID=UPI001584857F|nr:sugar ABC transporter substrate-binding protein [Leifsonia sp. C5G2]NUU07742.1 sugar ABC transporter substrate-binding protein [Leifsonia sp. C5G2]
MRKGTIRVGALVAGIAAASLALAGCSSSGSSDSASGGKVTLTFQSLAYQDTTVAATKEIVDSWNKANPDIQVKLQQGSWDNVHDQLVTQFQGGTAPDIIHDESADIMGFAQQGYLADLGGSLSADTKKQVSKDVWKSVTTPDGKIVAAPTLLQSYVVFANKKAFTDAGVAVPTGSTMSWDDFESLSKKLTANGSFGTGWGLKSPTATVMNLALGFGGTFFDNKDGKSTIHVGDDELQVPKRINAMAYADKSLDPVSLTQSGTDVLPGFFGGKYAMYVGGNYVAQQITESAPSGFDWVVLPPLAGSKGADQAANPQTMSVSAQSKHIPQAAKFIDYFMKADNQAKLAEGDWLIPASQAARDQVAKDTSGKNGWDVILKSGDELTAAPFQAATNYPQWKDQYATPALQKYLANSISLDDLKKQLADGWSAVG